MKKAVITILSIVLVWGGLSFSMPSKAFASSASIEPDNGIQVIIETDQYFEYLMIENGQKTKYEETIEEIDSNTTKITTKVYTDEDKLIQHFSTTLENYQIIDQEVIKFDSIPTTTEDTPSVLNEHSFSAMSTSSNRSRISGLGINYTKNFSTGRGTANYVGLASRTASLATSSEFNTHANAVDSMRSVENGTTVGIILELVGSTGSIAWGQAVSWATAKKILTRFVGPVAVLTNAWSLSSWFYYYNKIANNYMDI